MHRAARETVLPAPAFPRVGIDLVNDRGVVVATADTWNDVIEIAPALACGIYGVVESGGHQFGSITSYRDGTWTIRGFRSARSITGGSTKLTAGDTAK